MNDYIRSVPPQDSGPMTSEEENKVGMAECGSCRAVIPIDSTSCPECNTSFQGVSDEALGECGACKSLVPLDSTRCPNCGVLFVADDVVDVLRQWIASTGIDLRKLFEKFDVNNDGMIDASELREGLLSLNLADLPPTQVDRLVDEIDEDDNGVIDLDEFIQILETETHDEVEANESASDQEIEDAGEEPIDENDLSDHDDEPVIDDVDDVSLTDDIDDAQPVEEDEDGSDGVESNSEEATEQNNSAGSRPHALQALVDMMDEMGISAQRVFNDLDKDGNGSITMNELTALLESDYGEGLDMEALEQIMADADEDRDGSIDLTEFWESMESLDDEGVEEIEEDTDYFPTKMQKRMMSKQWNDAVWPILHTGFVLLLIVLLVNGLVGPVDGSGGSVVYEPIENGIVPFGVEAGDTFPCDEKYQNGGCANSLTPLAGEASSMPKGFYWDGILFMLLSIVGLAGSLFMHLVRVPAWRARARAMKEFEADKADAVADDAMDSEKDLVEIEDRVEDEAQEATSEAVEELDELEDDQEPGDEESEDDADDEIDIGSHIGLEFDGEEVFGVIVEFDDEEETVTIEEDGTGDIITGYQEDMFVE